jgi:hypothetical protein
MLWMCRSSTCDYEGATAVSRYCPWCCQDLIPACLTHRLPLDPRTGHCVDCGNDHARLGQPRMAHESSFYSQSA